MELNLEQRFMIYRSQQLIKSNDPYNSILMSSLGHDLNRLSNFVEVTVGDWVAPVNIPGLLVMTSNVELKDRNGRLKLVNVSICDVHKDYSTLAGAILLTESEFALFWQENIQPHVERRMMQWSDYFKRQEVSVYDLV